MRIYAIHFRKYEGGYNGSSPSYVEQKTNNKKPDKLYVDREAGLLVPDYDIGKYIEYGGGYTKVLYAGEMNDDYFHPIISQVERVEDKIKDRKNGNIIGSQS